MDLEAHFQCDFLAIVPFGASDDWVTVKGGESPPYPNQYYGLACPTNPAATAPWSYNYIGAVEGGPATTGTCARTGDEIATHAGFECVPPGEHEIRLYRQDGWDSPAWRRRLTITAGQFPTRSPTGLPTAAPSMGPIFDPTGAPTASVSTASPTASVPTASPTASPPASVPTASPTVSEPTTAPAPELIIQANANSDDGKSAGTSMVWVAVVIMVSLLAIFGGVYFHHRQRVSEGVTDARDNAFSNPVYGSSAAPGADAGGRSSTGVVQNPTNDTAPANPIAQFLQLQSVPAAGGAQQAAPHLHYGMFQDEGGSQQGPDGANLYASCRPADVPLVTSMNDGSIAGYQDVVPSQAMYEEIDADRNNDEAFNVRMR